MGSEYEKEVVELISNRFIAVLLLLGVALAVYGAVLGGELTYIHGAGVLR